MLANWAWLEKCDDIPYVTSHFLAILPFSLPCLLLRGALYSTKNFLPWCSTKPQAHSKEPGNPKLKPLKAWSQMDPLSSLIQPETYHTEIWVSALTNENNVKFLHTQLTLSGLSLHGPYTHTPSHKCVIHISLNKLGRSGDTIIRAFCQAHLQQCPLFVSFILIALQC